ncbi:MAG TPA: imidazole glycerol phosphate synthase subunit HisH [Thermoanaerobaculaceae bacterium]|nr:imidazole glycerol phosphate synthase subunit HisH [Thermoanaerobaculaceae bacterium]
MKTVVVVDYGVGNIPNAVRGLQRAGADVTLSADPGVVAAAERLVLPGVGAFPAAMARLEALHLDVAIRDVAAMGVPVLGICLGHQLLFEASEEFGSTPGLGLLAGRVVPLPPVARVPHLGWSSLRTTPGDPLVEGLDGGYAYFVHSFAVLEAADAVATFDFGGVPVCAAVRRGTICGTQFHPEKSAAPGARLLSNFLGLSQ